MTVLSLSQTTIASRAAGRIGRAAVTCAAAGLIAFAAVAPAAGQKGVSMRPEEVAAELGAGLDAALAGPQGEGLHAVLVMQAGRLIYERYLEGDDEIWGRKKAGVVFTPESLHDLRSITKSVVSLLYGIALADGSVPAPQTPVLDAFPDYADLAADEARGAITVQDVLSMTMGTEWSEALPYSDPKNSEIAMNRAADSLRYVLDRPLVAEAGTTWTYNGGATEVLGALIDTGVEGGLPAFARDRLFAPLDISKFEWITDYYGRPHAASALRLRPRDTLKIGQLVLKEGVLEGRQVVPAAWIAEATTEHAEGGFGCRYGYKWWLCATEGGLPVINASGYGGQELLIVPDLELVMMVAAGLYGDETAFDRAFDLLNDVVIPRIVVFPDSAVH